MGRRDIPSLGYALLGLLSERPSSGYDLRKIFASTPMGTFSDSPGAIYPALRRLEEAKLIRSRVEERAGLRRRKVFRPTSAGIAELRAWAARPVTRDDVMRRLDELLLRFAFMDSVIGAAGSVRFLEALARELEVHIPKLRNHLVSLQAKRSLSPRLALESGIFGYEAQLRWARHALSVFARAEAPHADGRRRRSARAGGA